MPWFRRVASRAAIAMVLSLGVLLSASPVAHADEAGVPVLVVPAPSENALLSGDGSYIVYSSGGVLYGKSVPDGQPDVLSVQGPDGSRLDINADGTIVGFVAANGEAHVVNRSRGSDEVIATGLSATDRIHVAALGASVWYSKALPSGTALFSHDGSAASSGPNSDAAVPVAGSVAAFVVDGHGATVVYTSDVQPYDLRRYSVATGVDEQLLQNISVLKDDSALSSSGRYLADNYVVIDLLNPRIILGTTGTGEVLQASRPRFSLDERWLVVSGTSRGGVWMVPVAGGLMRRVTHALDLGFAHRFPVSIDATGATVAYSSIAVANGPQYATYITPVVFDQQPPQVTTLTADGAILGQQTVAAHITDAGSGIGYVDVHASSPTYGDSSIRLHWSDLQCQPDNLGFRDDRDCQAAVGPLGDGSWTVTFDAVDVDGNPAPPQTVHVTFDHTAPTVTGTPDRAANAHGWYRAPVTITWSATDAYGPATIPSASTATTDGQNQLIISGPSCDQVGNCTTGSYVLSIDQTPPTIQATPDRPPNTAGWYDAPVHVTFQCNDTLSGIDFCPAPIDVTTDGRGQNVSGTATDVAGNPMTSALTVNLDTTAPTASVTSGNLILASFNQQLTGTASDTLSGAARVTVTMTSPTGTTTMSSDPGGGVTLNCNIAQTSCTWSARPTLRGFVAMTIRTYDTAGNQAVTTTSAVVL